MGVEDEVGGGGEAKGWGLMILLIVSFILIAAAVAFWPEPQIAPDPVRVTVSPVLHGSSGLTHMFILALLKQRMDQCRTGPSSASFCRWGDTTRHEMPQVRARQSGW